MRPAEGLEKPRLHLQGVSPCWLANTQGRKSRTQSCLFTTLPSPNRQTSQPAHSTSQPGGRSGERFGPAAERRTGTPGVDPGGFVESVVGTHPGAASWAGDTVGVHARQAAPQKWPSAESQALGEDSVQLLRDDPEGLGCEQGGPEPTVHAHGQGGSESPCGRHGPCAHHRAPQGCAGAMSRQALGSTQRSAPRRAPWRHPCHATAWCWTWGRQVPGEVCGGEP